MYFNVYYINTQRDNKLFSLYIASSMKIAQNHLAPSVENTRVYTCMNQEPFLFIFMIQSENNLHLLLFHLIINTLTASICDIMGKIIVNK